MEGEAASMAGLVDRAHGRAGLMAWGGTSATVADLVAAATAPEALGSEAAVAAVASVAAAAAARVAAHREVTAAVMAAAATAVVRGSLATSTQV